MTRPSTNGTNGRTTRGRFAPGNRYGVGGNPFARKVATFRSALFDAITRADVQAIARALLKSAKGGDTSAAKILLAYLLGEPLPFDVMNDLDELRTRLQEVESWQPDASTPR